MSWIHISDLLHRRTRDRQPICAVVNAVAPAPERQGDFQRALARSLRRPYFMRIPAVALRIALGEMSESLVVGQRVRPGACSMRVFRRTAVHRAGRPTTAPVLADDDRPLSWRSHLRGGHCAARGRSGVRRRDRRRTVHRPGRRTARPRHPADAGWPHGRRTTQPGSMRSPVRTGILAPLAIGALDSFGPTGRLAMLAAAPPLLVLAVLTRGPPSVTVRRRLHASFMPSSALIRPRSAFLVCRRGGRYRLRGLRLGLGRVHGRPPAHTLRVRRDTTCTTTASTLRIRRCGSTGRCSASPRTPSALIPPTRRGNVLRGGGEGQVFATQALYQTPGTDGRAVIDAARRDDDPRRAPAGRGGDVDLPTRRTRRRGVRMPAPRV